MERKETVVSEDLGLVYQSIENQHENESARTRRQFVAGAAATLGGLGLLSLSRVASAQEGNDPQTILNVATTAEVLATIVNTVGAERTLSGGGRGGLDDDDGLLDDLLDLGGDDDDDGNGRRSLGGPRRAVRAAAQEELIHYKVLRSVGGKPITKRMGPNRVFASPENLLRTLEVGDQIFVNA